MWQLAYSSIALHMFIAEIVLLPPKSTDVNPNENMGMLENRTFTEEEITNPSELEKYLDNTSG